MYEKGIFEFIRGPCKLTQDEGSRPSWPCLVVEDVLFGDEVHAIVQRGDQSQVRTTVERFHFLLVEDPLHELDWRPAAPDSGKPLPVDIMGQASDLRRVLGIGGEAFARWTGDLEELESSAKFRSPLEQQVDGPKLLKQPFGVVHAIDSKRKEPGGPNRMKMAEGV
jgi:hypothetical protein